jgi:hypothetical protein
MTLVIRFNREALFPCGVAWADFMRKPSETPRRKRGSPSTTQCDSVYRQVRISWPNAYPSSNIQLTGAQKQHLSIGSLKRSRQLQSQIIKQRNLPLWYRHHSTISSSNSRFFFAQPTSSHHITTVLTAIDNVVRIWKLIWRQRRTPHWSTRWRT